MKEDATEGIILKRKANVNDQCKNHPFFKLINATHNLRVKDVYVGQQKKSS